MPLPWNLSNHTLLYLSITTMRARRDPIREMRETSVLSNASIESAFSSASDIASHEEFLRAKADIDRRIILRAARREKRKLDDIYEEGQCIRATPYTLSLV